jgi:hypothetical protein
MKIEEEENYYNDCTDHSFGKIDDDFSIRSSVINILDNKPFSSLAK